MVNLVNTATIWPSSVQTPRLDERDPNPEARLPTARGPLSAILVDALGTSPGSATFPVVDAESAAGLGEDVQLALQVCYEQHYRGFARVDPSWEWDPELLRFRNALERAFLTALRAEVPGGTDVDAELSGLLVDTVPGTGVSHFLRDQGEWWQFQELAALRSIYHLKEADPHAWVIPRLRGRAKAALVAVEFDEFGAGRPDHAHARLFVDLLVAADLCADYLYYLDSAPACALATVNVMSLFGLHRQLRGALVGHLTAAEISTSPSARRIDRALGRMGAAPACRRFYTEHIEADAVHEQVMRHDVIGGLLEEEPTLAGDVVFGLQATELLEARLARHLLDAWGAGRSALRV